MTNTAYLADELALIGISFMPESREHLVIRDIIEILTELDAKEKGGKSWKNGLCRNESNLSSTRSRI